MIRKGQFQIPLLYNCCSYMLKKMQFGPVSWQCKRKYGTICVAQTKRHPIKLTRKLPFLTHHLHTVIARCNLDPSACRKSPLNPGWHLILVSSAAATIKHHYNSWVIRNENKTLTPWCWYVNLPSTVYLSKQIQWNMDLFINYMRRTYHNIHQQKNGTVSL